MPEELQPTALGPLPPDAPDQLVPGTPEVEAEARRIAHELVKLWQDGAISGPETYALPSLRT
jgi:hypothetical protein